MIERRLWSIRRASRHSGLVLVLALVMQWSPSAMAEDALVATMREGSRIGVLSLLPDAFHLQDARLLRWGGASSKPFPDDWRLQEKIIARAGELLAGAGLVVVDVAADRLDASGIEWRTGRMRMAGEGIVPVPTGVDSTLRSELDRLVSDHRLDALVLFVPIDVHVRNTPYLPGGIGIVVSQGLGRSSVSAFMRYAAVAWLPGAGALADTGRCAPFAALPREAVTPDQVRSRDAGTLLRIRPLVEAMALDQVEQDLRGSGLLGTGSAVSCRDFRGREAWMAEVYARFSSP